jgi:deoxyribodipyrimidine photo-lyase
MQAGITNPLSNTFRICNPNKNIQKKDPDLKFLYYAYSLPEIIQGKYIGTSSYPQTILDWAKTRKFNGKIISDLRKKVRERLTL